MARGSIAGQVTAFAFAVLAAAILAALVAVALVPDEPPKRVTFGDAVAALSGQSSPLQVRVSTSPPRGPASRLVTTALSRKLGLPIDAVSAVWLDDPGRFTSGREGSVVAIVAGREVAISSHGQTFYMSYGGGVDLSPATAIPPFEAAVHRPDGTWLRVRPKVSTAEGWRLRLGLWILLGGVLIASMIQWGARALTRPIQALAEGADRAALSEDTPPIIEEGAEEIRALARAINGMHARLLAAVRDRTRMMTAVAHDLRTPLTALRVRVEAAPPPARERMTADIDRMAAMIERVMAYAHENPASAPKTDVDFSALVASCIENAVLAGHQVQAERLEAGVIVDGRAEELSSAVQNLIDNAALYAGQARVSCFRTPGQAVLQVEDDGPGIPEADLTKVLEPFVRLEASRSVQTGGVGLGLAIADRNARRNGGRLALENRIGGGLRAQLTFPER